MRWRRLGLALAGMLLALGALILVSAAMAQEADRAPATPDLTAPDFTSITTKAAANRLVRAGRLAANQAEIFYRKYSNSDVVPVVRRAATALMYKSMVDYTLHNDREAESLVLRTVIQEFGGKYSDREILEIVSVAERRLAS